MIAGPKYQLSSFDNHIKAGYNKTGNYTYSFHVGSLTLSFFTLSLSDLCVCQVKSSKRFVICNLKFVLLNL